MARRDSRKAFRIGVTVTRARPAAVGEVLLVNRSGVTVLWQPSADTEHVAWREAYRTLTVVTPPLTHHVIAL